MSAVEFVMARVFLPEIKPRSAVELRPPMPGYNVYQVIYLGEREDPADGEVKKECLVVFAGTPVIVRS